MNAYKLKQRSNIMKNKNNRPIYFEEYKKINGIEQYLFHAGTSYENPVILFLHAFASAESLMTNIFQKDWEEIFTVVHLDQRGAGKTFTKNPTAAPTMELQLEDIHETILYLKERYQKEKIILVGHSWGSVLGSIYAKRHPENVAYYVGTGQVISVLKGERAGYEKAMEIAMQRKDMKSQKKLESIARYPYGEPEDFIKECTLLRTVQQKYHLAPSKLSYIPLLKAMVTSPIFQFSDIHAFLGAEKINSSLNNEMMNFDLDEESYEYKVPIYYILGADDWQVPYTLSKDYFQKIEAPRKKLYMLKGAGHFTMNDKPKEFFEALADINANEEKY